MGPLAMAVFSKLRDVAELTVHFQDGDLLVEHGVRTVLEHHTWVLARKFLTARHPSDGGTLVEEVTRHEVILANRLDELHLEDLACVVLGEFGGKYLDHKVGVSTLWGHKGIEIWLAGLNGGFDGLERVSSLLHVALHLPREFDVVSDVQINRKVEELAYALVHEWVQPFDDKDWRGLDRLWFIEGAVHMVVDGFLDFLSTLESRDLLIHEVELLLLGV